MYLFFKILVGFIPKPQMISYQMICALQPNGRDGKPYNYLFTKKYRQLFVYICVYSYFKVTLFNHMWKRI